MDGNDFLKMLCNTLLTVCITGLEKNTSNRKILRHCHQYWDKLQVSNNNQLALIECLGHFQDRGLIKQTFG